MAENAPPLKENTFAHAMAWIQENTALCATIVIVIFFLIAIWRKESVKTLISLILKETYYRRVLLVTLPVVVTSLVYIYPSSISAYIIVVGYITSLAISEKATSMAVEKKGGECQEVIDSSSKENETLRNIINDKKTYFIDKILSRLQSIQSNKRLKTKEDVINEVSKFSYSLMAEKTLFESADEALSNYSLENSVDTNLAERTIIE